MSKKNAKRSNKATKENKKYNLKNVFLITPQTSNERILQIDSVSDSFIYMVSTASVTGNQTGFGKEQMEYFERI